MKTGRGLGLVEGCFQDAPTFGPSEKSMRRVARGFSCLGLLFAGYVLGSLQIGGLAALRAEPQSESLPEAVAARVRDANRVVSDAMQGLQEEKRYVPAIQGVNAFAVTVGGVDAVADLESGQGVDPETFAGLYAGQALPDIAEHIARNAEGHLMYKNKSIRIYSATRLGELFALRAKFAPAAAAAAPTAKRATPTPAKKGADADAEKEKSE
jgi:hypothetical protein